MDNDIRIVQFFDLKTSGGTVYRYQNFFVGLRKRFGSKNYDFAPFQVMGQNSSLNGDSEQLSVLFPALDVVVALVEGGDGNRKSVLNLHTRFVNRSGDYSSAGPRGVFFGLGASFNDDTVELRFSSALDAAASQFPATTLTEANAGILPLESQLQLR
jgi:hypothetical protein